ncbi:MAG TPA: bifunctional pyr operon transcriptional regulator/uracil phosphoribosyltransferase PyrR [Phycisphaerae bacterium]|nr:bifunctional pyr operon transcriptional regulator/uracil phosphoribosyltransferase PyrR [Phycisphaerae bacterium]HOJ74724.1 bifunctional pyr operon transcriptional regulator/uracil phosphoribosyltransferase PyrR [Phycisphaerae bacterium]HOM52093.1 bifunctional pyr operon transcriptional regulator/uracil phosphoribosyltransferase PyrR [Phycisphaerae bacterium]HON65296.1 bifunctional pyr operon transcriptional regulator/uracil phosphoribosyltransferase PyrR [Phycisphaerae bacterium]HOQ86507.1 
MMNDSASTQTLLDASKIQATLEQLAREIAADLPPDTPTAVIGIRRRGEVLAERLIGMLRDMGLEGIRHGSLDITLYRDDLAELGPQAIVRRTEIDFDISGMYVILVDDVLYTGRSARAAMDALIDLGRPKAIRLAVLIERPGRELPIQADYIGLRVPQQDVQVTVLLQESDQVEEVRVG